jgi:hypothetical protein
MLNEVAYSGIYREWGFDDFEAYMARDLGISKNQARKLMAGTNLVRELGMEGKPPEITVASLLLKAKDREDVPEHELNGVVEDIKSGYIDDDTARHRLSLLLRPATLPGMGDYADKVALLRVLNKARKIACRLNRQLVTQIEETLDYLGTMQ